jgi:HlyD family secretion protein
MKRTSLLILAALLLAGCGMLGGPTPQPLPTVMLGTMSPTSQASTQSPLGGVVASGIVVPAQQTQMVFSLGAKVKTVSVAEGDHVTAGQVLVTLEGSEKLAAAVAAANLELLSAQQALNNLNDQADLARAQAQQTLANAQKALKDAQDDRYRKNLARVSQATLDQVRADLIIAQDELDKAQENYDKFAYRPENDLMRAQAFSRLSAAQQKVDQIQWNLDWLTSRPDTIEVQQADAAIQVAQAQLAEAQKEVDRLKDGPDPQALTLAEARLDNAKAQLDASQVALNDLELKAPFPATVSQINIHSGEWVTPGQPVVVLADLDHLQVQTTDLSERDVPRIQLGQSVTVSVKALNQSIQGRLTRIAPMASTLGGDVVYQTTIDLETLPAGLRAGMSVDVAFGTGE